MRARRAVALVGLLAGLPAAGLGMAGCGDSLADGAYPGEPLYTVAGPLILADFEQVVALAECQGEAELCSEDAFAACEAAGDEDAPCPAADRCFDDLEACLAGEGADVALFSSEVVLGVSLIWSDPGRGGAPFEQASTIDPGLPATYRLTVYQPPPDSTLRRTAAGDYAVGVLVAFEDLDGDGSIDPAYESVLGGTTELAVLFTPTGLDDPTLGRFAPGFHRVAPTDDWCDHRQGTRFAAPEDERSPIRFGRIDQIAPILLPDLDCRSGLSEWGLCPLNVDLDRCEELRPPLYCAFCDVEDDGGEGGEEGEGDDGGEGEGEGEGEEDDPDARAAP